MIGICIAKLESLFEDPVCQKNMRNLCKRVNLHLINNMVISTRQRASINYPCLLLTMQTYILFDMLICTEQSRGTKSFLNVYLKKCMEDHKKEDEILKVYDGV